MLHLRPMLQDATHDRFYSPQRDLATNGPYLVRTAVRFVDAYKTDPDLAAFLQREGVTEDQLVEVASKLSQMLNLIVKTKTPDEAMRATDFLSLPFPARAAFFHTMGQVLLCAIWSAVKDVNRPSGTPSDVRTVMDDIEAALSDFRSQPRS